MSVDQITARFKVQEISSFISNFSNAYGNTMYFFVSDHIPHPNNVIQNANTDVSDLFINPYLKMIMGKQLGPQNFLPSIVNYPYVSNTIFSMYDDQNPNLFGQMFYTIVNQGQFSHVFKVLDNNGGIPSTVQPDFTQIIGANTILYQTADGYRWKYMCSTDTTTTNNASTATYFPLLPNNQVIAAALPGTIDIVTVSFGGKLYNNWITGIFATSDIAIGGNPLLFNISNNQVNTTNGYYNDCILYLTSGPGIGEFAVINVSFSNTTGTYMQITNAFAVLPNNASTYQVYPQCHIVGTGLEQQQVIARALVNTTASNSIYRIEVLQRGIGFANTLGAFVSANGAVGVSANATVRAILPPPGGHGSDPNGELNATVLTIWAQLNSGEGNTILTNNQFQQIGLLANPVFSNAHLTLNLTSGPFQTGETIYLVNPIQVQSQCNVQLSSNFVSANNASFLTTFSANSPIMLVSNTGTFSQLAYVNNVVNSNFLFLQSNVNFSCTNVIVYNPNIYGNCVATTINSLTDIFVANVSATLTSNAFLLGSVSGVFATLSQIQRNDVTKQFNTFVQLNKYSVTVVSGSFIPNEIVMQGNTSGFYHSGNSATIYLSSVNGVVFLSGQNLIGQQSGAVAQITKIYQQELVFNSGTIYYIENIAPITRQLNQVEAFKLSFQM